MITTDHITELRTEAPGLEILVRVFDKGMTLTITRQDVEGSPGRLVLKGSQIRRLREILNLAVEEEQS